jgi:hypothetical protein
LRNRIVVVFKKMGLFVISLNKFSASTIRFVEASERSLMKRSEIDENAKTYRNIDGILAPHTFVEDVVEFTQSSHKHNARHVVKTVDPLRTGT